MICDRCGANENELYYTGCGDVGYQAHPGECADDKEALGDVCGACWARLSHVDGLIGCSGNCTCLEDYPDVAADAAEDAVNR